MRSFTATTVFAVSVALAAPTIVPRSVGTALATTCDTPATFRLAAQPLNDTSQQTLYGPYNNAGSDPYQFLFAPDSGSPFSYDSSNGRLTALVKDTSAPAILYSSIIPVAGQILQLNNTPTDAAGHLGFQCDTNGHKYLVDLDTQGQNFLAPWLKCQIPGWTTGLTEIVYNPTSLTYQSETCTRVGLAAV